MKHLLYLICLFFVTSSLAQDPQLFDTTWVLHELILDENSITSPIPAQDAQLIFNESEDLIIIRQDGCDDNSEFSGGIDSYSEMSSFSLFVFGNPFGSNCNNQTTLDFLFTHAGFYEEPISNSFNYEITTDNGVITLIITNGENDVAIYRNIPLSVTDTEISVIQLLYNSKTKQLTFSGLQEKNNLNIYNLLGQEVLHTTVKEDIKISVSDLKQGIYLAQLSQGGKQEVYKFVKY